MVLLIFYRHQPLAHLPPRTRLDNPPSTSYKTRMQAEYWVALAKRRVLRMLDRRRFASIRQLEKKISEAGPPSVRAEPIKISKALASLVAKNQIISEPHPNLATFFKPASFGGDPDEARRAYILTLTRQFHRLTQNPVLCGGAFETVVRAAALASEQYRVISPAKQGLEIDGYAVERECDQVLIPKKFIGPAIIVEDKNLREWLTPSSEEVWALIGKALRFPEAIPVLICRRMHYVGFTVFKHIGLSCWQVFRQYFDPSLESQLAEIRHTDGLGFSDVTTVLNPPPALVGFFARTLPAYADSFRTRFEENRALLQHYAIDLGLEHDTPSFSRTKLFNEFRRELLSASDPDSPPHDF